MSKETENNKPVAQKVVEEADTTPKATGTKGNTAALKGKDRVTLRNRETGYVHEQLPASTAEVLLKKNPNGFEIL